MAHRLESDELERKRQFTRAGGHDKEDRDWPRAEFMLHRDNVCWRVTDGEGEEVCANATLRERMNEMEFRKIYQSRSIRRDALTAAMYQIIENN